METQTVAPAAQIIISIIPIVGITFGAIVVFFALLWHHRETKLRILKGVYSPIHFNMKAFSLLTGILLTGLGTVLTVIFALMEGKSYIILGGLIPLVLGLMLIIFYALNPDFKSKKDGNES